MHLLSFLSIKQLREYLENGSSNGCMLLHVTHSFDHKTLTECYSAPGISHT